MLYHLEGVIMSDGSLRWNSMKGHFWEKENGAKLSFFPGSENRREARKKLVSAIAKENLSWITYKRNKWSLDLDELKEFIALIFGAETLIQIPWEWFKGKVPIEPEYETEERSDSGKSRYETRFVFYIVHEVLESLAKDLEIPTEIKEEFLSRLEELIQEGEGVRASAKSVAHSSFKKVDNELFYKWKTSCLSFLERHFETETYLRTFKNKVKSTFLDRTEQGMAALNALKGDLEKGYLDNYISAKEKKVEKLKVDNYVDEGRIKELASLPKDKFDSARLVKLCEELNKCYKNNCELAVAAMVRTILNHVPPIFKMSNFEEVANNYSWGKGKLKGKSKRKVMSDLEDTARNIADIHLHQPIRETESLPSMTQVNFKNQLDVLLEEIVRILKSQAKGKKTT